MRLLTGLKAVSSKKVTFQRAGETFAHGVRSSHQLYPSIAARSSCYSVGRTPAKCIDSLGRNDG